MNLFHELLRRAVFEMVELLSFTIFIYSIYPQVKWVHSIYHSYALGIPVWLGLILCLVRQSITDVSKKMNDYYDTLKQLWIISLMFQLYFIVYCLFQSDFTGVAISVFGLCSNLLWLLIVNIIIHNETTGRRPT